MAIALDASSPAIVTGNNGSAVSASFTPPDSTVLVACLISNGTSPNNTGTPTFSCSGGSLTWTKRAERIDTDTGSPQEGGAAIYTAPVTTGASMTVTGGNGGTTDEQIAVKVYALTGCDLASPVGATGEGSSTTNNITPTAYTSTATGSRAIGCASEWNALGAPVSTDDESSFHIAMAVSGTAVIKAANSGASGSSITLNFDGFGTGGAAWNWCAVEIKPATVTTSLPPLPRLRRMQHLLVR